MLLAQPLGYWNKNVATRRDRQTSRAHCAHFRFRLSFRLAFPFDALRVVIVPGMGCCPTLRCNWYSYLHEELSKMGVKSVALDFPDPRRCREHIWIKFLKETIRVDQTCILVGHSTGSEAILRSNFCCFCIQLDCWKIPRF